MSSLPNRTDGNKDEGIMDMRRTPTSHEEDEVRIVVTDAGRENLLFRGLLRQAAQQLRCPEQTSERNRNLLLSAIALALETPETDEDEDYVAEEGQSPWE